MGDLIQIVGIGIVILLPLANPITTVALFLGLSGNMTKQQRNRQAFLASIYVFIIMVVSFFFGQLIMSVFGISIPGLRIAGGLIVAFIGFRMLFPAKKLKLENSDEDEVEDIAFVPLAMPSTAGPGTIAMIISAASTINTQDNDISLWIVYASAIIVPLIISVILWICLMSADSIMKYIGKNGVEAISRIMGFLLVCIGTQFVINGIQEIVANITFTFNHLTNIISLMSF